MGTINYTYKTRPNYVFMVFMLLGAGFFIFLNSLVWPVKSYNGTALIVPVISGLFALLCLYLAVGFKIIYLTPTEIIITIPVVFYKRTLLMSDIKTLNDKDVTMDLNSKGFTPMETQIGNKIIVVMNDGKQIQLSSLQIGGYREFRKNLHSTFVSNGQKKH